MRFSLLIACFDSKSERIRMEGALSRHKRQQSRKGAELFEAGHSPIQIAKILGVARENVQQWNAALCDGGKGELKSVPQYDRTCRMTPE